MNTIQEGINDIAQGRMVIVVDDEARENEGDLVVAAQFATPEIINFMAHHGCGLICVPMEQDRLNQLSLSPMVQENTDHHGTAFTVSVDHVDCTTGISAFERAHTIARLIDLTSQPGDFRRPGHIFPLAARDGGVLARTGHTEATVDLVRLAGKDLFPAGVICEIMNEDGTMARRDDLYKFAAVHGLCIVTIADLVRFRRSREQLIQKITETKLPTKHGVFKLTGYSELHTNKEHLALSMGDISDGAPVLCRVHSECLTGDALGSRRCDCGEQYDEAMRRIAAEGRGVLVYLRQEGRGIGLINKLKAYALQDNGVDTVDANINLGLPVDSRDYQTGAQILKDLGVRSLKLMTNNPLKLECIEACGITISERIPLTITPNRYNEFYLHTKATKMKHLLDTGNTNTRSII